MNLAQISSTYSYLVVSLPYQRIGEIVPPIARVGRFLLRHPSFSFSWFISFPTANFEPRVHLDEPFLRSCQKSPSDHQSNDDDLRRPTIPRETKKCLRVEFKYELGFYGSVQSQYTVVAWFNPNADKPSSDLGKKLNYGTLIVWKWLLC